MISKRIDVRPTRARTIRGHKLTLVIGARYTAERPVADGQIRKFPIVIREVGVAEPIITIRGLSYAQAVAFQDSFAGNTSFGVRVWK